MLNHVTAILTFFWKNFFPHFLLELVSSIYLIRLRNIVTYLYYASNGVIEKIWVCLMIFINLSFQWMIPILKQNLFARRTIWNFLFWFIWTINIYNFIPVFYILFNQKFVTIIFHETLNKVFINIIIYLFFYLKIIFHF